MTESTHPAAMSSHAAERKGGIRWMFVHLFRWLGGLMARNKVRSIVTLMVLAFGLAVGRAYVQPLFVQVRILALELVFALILLAYLSYLRRKAKYLQLVAVVTVTAAFCSWLIYTGGRPHYYHTLYRQFKTLDKVQLDALPVTEYERIHPVHAIHTATNKRIADTMHTNVPDYVSWGAGKDPHWTLGIEPTFPHQRLFGKVERIFSLPGQNHLLDFGGENQIDVIFESGEEMSFAKNAAFLARQGFGLWRFLSYEPSSMKYIPGPDGKVVQCITLIKWDGIVFPRPHFGGVIILEQGETSGIDMLKRAFVGAGRWIKPEDVQNHEWLVGQNLVPYEVSRHMANSFRFRYGYWAPFPLTHYKDIRIPDLPGDVNDQPFTMYFDFGKGDKKSKLYHYFALEPFQDEKRDKAGLTISLLVPADGIGSVRYYEHAERRENLAGVSSISTFIKEDRKDYDWERNEVAEHRPYIRAINGKPKLFWLSTVVTKTDDGSGFVAGSAIEVFLTDAASTKPVQVDPARPHKWVDQVKAALGIDEKIEPDLVLP